MNLPIAVIIVGATIAAFVLVPSLKDWDFRRSEFRTSLLVKARLFEHDVQQYVTRRDEQDHDHYDQSNGECFIGGTLDGQKNVQLYLPR